MEAGVKADRDGIRARVSIYTQVALCIVGMSLYFNAGKIKARNGARDHAVLWAALSLVVSLVVFWTGAVGSPGCSPRWRCLRASPWFALPSTVAATRAPP